MGVVRGTVRCIGVGVLGIGILDTFGGSVEQTNVVILYTDNYHYYSLITTLQNMT